MATTIKTTALDFESIKQSLRQHFAESDQFADYDFEAAGLSNILDVLAYNTHYNGLIANFSLNESFLGTAQLRSSIIGLAVSLGYIPGSVASAQAQVNIKLNLAGVPNRPSILTIPAGATFTSDIDGVLYTFRTVESIDAQDNGQGLYQFTDSTDTKDIVIVEGAAKSKRFIVGSDDDNTVYVIPDKAMDTSTATVTVYQYSGSSAYAVYSDALKATKITSESKVYFLKESPNGNFELAFGDGTTFGDKLNPGNVIVVDYLRSSGAAGNDGEIFSPNFALTVDGNDYVPTITTVTDSSGGSAKEDIESIRTHAPFQFASQNRMVTADDYASLILRNFPAYIVDIRAYGGEDAPEPKYGTVYVSALFEDGLPPATITSVKSRISELVSRLAVASFDIAYVEPIRTYIEVETYFQYNPNETTLSKSKLESSVNSIIRQYFDDHTGLFEASFRRSNMLALIDDSSQAILSSRANIKMQQRVTPTLTVSNNFTLTYPQSIKDVDDKEHSITSSYFTINGKVCRIQNKLNSTKLEVWNVTDGALEVDNVGSYVPSTGRVNISGLTPESIVGENTFIKIKAVPGNQSALSPTLNNVLMYDADVSFSTAVITNADN